jgi:hypothetical protein
MGIRTGVLAGVDIGVRTGVRIGLLAGVRIGVLTGVGICDFVAGGISVLNLTGYGQLLYCLVAKCLHRQSTPSHLQ